MKLTRTALAAIAIALLAPIAPAIAGPVTQDTVTFAELEPVDGDQSIYDREEHDPFDQRQFPCQEDEVLGYAPQFGPDRVGCMHVEVAHGVAAADGGVPGPAA